MKAPDNIYLFKKPNDVILGTWFLDSSEQLDLSEQFESIEYTRTDALIEKVCKGIEHLLSGYIIKNFHFEDSYEIDTFIEDLKNHIKGE